VKGPPRIVLVVPIEGRAFAVLVCDSFEDEERFALDLAGRELLDELAEALRGLADALEEARAA
jgi:hypothetical protein